jgi:uncharacterized membrane protein
MTILIISAVAVFLIAAAAAHFITLAIIPRSRMNKIMARLPINAIRREHRPDYRSRSVVQPSPDLVYTNVRYDVSKAPILFTSPVPADNYWSVSIFQQNSDNFFVINDRQIKANPFKLMLVKRGQKAKASEDTIVVTSPTNKGILLVRHLVVSDDKSAEVTAIQRQAAVTIGSYND